MSNRPTKMVLLSVLYISFGTWAIPAHSGKPTCPGHPSCGGDDGDVQLGSGNDVWPGAGDDNSGDDTVNGGAGDDMISGGLGDDDLNGESGDDLLYGQDGNDRLTGGDGFDQLFGGPGEDLLWIDLSGVIMGGKEQGDYGDGGSSTKPNGKQHRDSLYLNFLDTVTVYFDTATSVGTYSGTYKTGKGKKASTGAVEGEFENIERIKGAHISGTYHGNDLDIEIEGGEADDFMYGYGGNDSFGSWVESGDDYFDGGTGNDYFQPLTGSDYIIGGPGSDRILLRESHGHNVMEDFEDAIDIISIYNSNVCFPDLFISMVDGDQDGDVDDTKIAYGGRASNPDGSITLLNFNAANVTPDDFDFESDNANYTGCP